MAEVRNLPASDREIVSTREVRAWAGAQGLDVGVRGHMPKAIYEAFNRVHRKTRALDTNPWTDREKRAACG